jgi:hypothetical protein
LLGVFKALSLEYIWNKNVAFQIVSMTIQFPRRNFIFHSSTALMARKLEKRSARILALILAFIMLGSVFAYMFPRSTPEKREVKVKIENIGNCIDLVPENGMFYYFNITELKLLYKKLGSKDPLVNFTEAEATNALRSSYMNTRIVQFDSNSIQEFILAEYGYYPIYFINENDSKVYFAKDTEYSIGNYTMQVSKYGVAMLNEISPLVIGYYPLVMEAAKNLNEGRKTEYSGYLSRLNETYVFAFFTYGNHTGDIVKLNQTNESIMDFFFQGFRYNFTSQRYEKVWGVHFTQNYFFTELNESEKDFEYYYFENFDDGFSVAVMGDKNFTRTFNAVPKVMGFIIKEVEAPQKE